MINLKNPKILVLVAVVLLVFCPAMLSLSSNFGSSDFTSLEGNSVVVDGKWQMKNQLKTYYRPKHSDGRYYRLDYSEIPTYKHFCYDRTNSYNYYNLTSFKIGSGTVKVWSSKQNKWIDRPDAYLNGIETISCDNPDSFFGSDILEQKNSFTTTEKYNYFELESNLEENGAIIKPYLVLGEDKYYFKNNKLKLKNEIPSDTMYKVGFEIAGFEDKTYTLQNVTLLGSLKTSSGGGETLNMIGTFGDKTGLNVWNPMRVLANFFANVGTFLESIFGGLF